MIFVTLGSQKFQFNRLLEHLDCLIETGVLTEKVFAQTGAGTYIPRHYGYQAFLDQGEFDKRLSQCDIVLTHGGAGTIISAIRKGKKVIAVPRLAEYGEHVDNHQIQIIRQFEKMNLICACMDPGDLGDAFQRVRAHEYSSYQCNTEAVMDSIRAFLSQS